jgi:hypothetical protein
MTQRYAHYEYHQFLLMVGIRKIAYGIDLTSIGSGC